MIINGAEASAGLGEPIDVPYLTAELRRQADTAKTGDLAQAEELLMHQATPQGLFARLAESGRSCDTVPAFDVDMRVALRAQSPCRATLETLAAIKNPPIVYARQVNGTAGPQQVDNCVPAPSRGEIQISPSKLLGADNGQRPDTRAQATNVEAIKVQSWKPWRRSTGPRTAKGKARVARNAYKGGGRELLRAPARALRQQRDAL